MQVVLDRGYLDEEAALRVLRQKVSRYLYSAGTERRAGKRYLSFGLSVQEAIPDHDGEGSVVRSLDFDDVAIYTVSSREGKIILEGPSRQDIDKRAREMYSSVVSKSHRALLPTIYQRLVHIPEVSLSMSPLRKILIFLEEVGQATPEGIRRPDQKSSRVEKYFALLEDLGYIARDNGVFVPGKEFSKLKAGDVEPPELYERILGEVIRRRSKYLQEVLHWTMMVPFLRWSNSYYLPAYEAGHLLRLERDDLAGFYFRFYRYSHRKAQIINQLQRTVDSGALRRERPFYLGDQTIMEEYFRRADQTQVLSSTEVIDTA